jgi:hypothetical protein
VSAVQVGTFPTTYFLNAEGVIVKMQAGELKSDDIETILRDDLGVTG